MHFQSNPQLELAESYLHNTGVSIFLTGKAGTGKTTFLRNVLPRLDKRHVIVAPTGVAAINAGGVTIHSFFQLPPCPYLPDVPELITEYQLPEGKKQLRKSRINIIRTLDLLVIDEISMVRADLLDSIDNTLRRYRRNSRPFGGVQLLMIGDIHQLPPVVTAEEEPYLKRVYQSPFFFESKAFKLLNYITVELTTVYRQQDSLFLSLLNHVRDNQLDPPTLELLNSRYKPDIEAYFKTQPSMPIRLTTHNSQADQVNRRNLDRIDKKERLFEASVKDNFPENAYPAEKTLRLKEGAQVMFIKNDPSGNARYYNGRIGIVRSFDLEQNHIVVESEGDSIDVERVEWENVKYDINKSDNSITQIIDGTFTQFPLRLAWAVTIHKAQGLTFDNVIVDAADAFAYGQVYVALSRCRSLEGLVLSSRITSSCAYDSVDVDTFNRSQPSEDTVRQNYEANAFNYYIDMLFDLLSVKQLYDAALRIDQFNRAYLTDIAPKAVSQWNEWTPRLAALSDVYEKFRNQIARMTTAVSSASEAKAIVADRIAKAVAYFYAQIDEAQNAMLPLLDIEIDNKERAKDHKEYTETFSSIIGLKCTCLKQAASHGFSVEGYQKSKCDFLLDEKKSESSTETKIPRQRKTSESDASNLYNLKHPDILPRLIAWRREKYEDAGVPAFQILTQKAMLGIAKAMPRSLDELAKVKGIGKIKLRAFGEELISIIEQFCREKGI
ncbi:MAG: HRDC domain-containing protein [Bacteroidales bacterium]|nr:HRDC domain-containing protein [Bacteroidales bacterium]